MKKTVASAQLKQQCCKTLLTLLDDMFASCDDLFFDLASRASNNVEQNLYFESMRIVRIGTGAAAKKYQAKLDQGFASLQHQSKQQVETNIQPEELSVVGKDDLELDVAITSMTTRARTASKTALYELSSRLCTLFNLKNIDETNNPLDPGNLTKAFADSSEDIAVDIKARIILLKQYERYVLNRLPELYHKANTLLDKHGIPFNDQRKTQKRSTQSSSGSQRTKDETTEETPLLISGFDSGYRYGALPFTELSNLLSNYRAAPSHIGGQIGGQHPSFFSSSDANAGMLQNNELINLLGSAQGYDATHNHSFDLRTYVQQLLAQGLPKGKAHAVQKMDEDVINLVAMFFDFVLDDKNIPDAVKALVSRLQMAILKVALNDKHFFSDSEHPSREFINEIARISIGVDGNDPGSNDLLEHIEQWVQDIQTAVHNTENAFKNALDELRTFTQQQEKRANLVQKRTSDAAKGQAIRHIATIKSQRAIQEAMDGKSVALTTSDFIVNHWQQVLYSTYTREGEDSPTWLSHLQTMQDLIWCSQEHKDDKSHQRFARIVVNLFQNLETGLVKTTLSANQVKAQIQSLKQLLGTFAAQFTNNENNSDPIDVQSFDASTETSLQTLKKQKGWQEMTALERQKVEFQALTYEFIEKAEAIGVGSWLEFKEPASGTIIRCKLAAKLEGSDTYVFVNRLGFKATEKPRKEFAYDLQRKRARLLKTGPLFERSLHKMVSSLKAIGR